MSQQFLFVMCMFSKVQSKLHPAAKPRPRRKRRGNPYSQPTADSSP